MPLSLPIFRVMMVGVLLGTETLAGIFFWLSNVQFFESSVYVCNGYRNLILKGNSHVSVQECIKEITEPKKN